MPIQQARSELRQRGETDIGARAVRRASQCPQNVEDVLKHGDRNQHPHFSILEISEVGDKGLELALRIKLRVGDYSTRLSQPHVVQIVSQGFLRLQGKQNRSQWGKDRSSAAVLEPGHQAAVPQPERGWKEGALASGPRQTKLLLCNWLLGDREGWNKAHSPGKPPVSST